MNRKLDRYIPATVVAALALGAVATGFAQQSTEPTPLRITRITPAGTDVPEGRQVVFQFDRPVVPLGRMDRSAADIPIEIAPALDCRWRWIDTSALACQLGADDALRLATRYSIVVNPGITALDGATLAAPRRHEFVTQRPQVQYAGFATWRGPGTPVIRVAFSQPVTAASVRQHLFISAANGGAARSALVVETDPDDPQSRAADGASDAADARGAVDSDPEPARDTTPPPDDLARRFWLVSPAEPLPDGARAQLRIEPGLAGAEGAEPGAERRVVVEFDTFPEPRFAGVTCSTNAGEQILVTAANAAGSAACNPLGGVGLSFTSPVPLSQVRDHVRIEPDLAAGREDYDPWANTRDYTQLWQPHRAGQVYTVWLPGRLDAARTYTVAADPRTGPRDEFDRPLAAPMSLRFATDHRPPDYTLAHPTAVLESAVDSDVPLYVTNLDSVSVDFRTLTAAGGRTDLSATLALPDVEDLSAAAPLGVRNLLGGASGAIYARLSTAPALDKSEWDGRLFAQVTPYQVHVKLGHFSTLVWVVDLASGQPVSDASVTLYTDRIADLSPSVAPIAEAVTDASGVAMLAGSELLDPALDLLGYGCGARHVDECPRLFVRVDGDAGLAVLPLDDRFETNVFRASNYSFGSQPTPAFGHLHAWGTTAQGVYRAGDTIEFKLYVRDQSNETYVAPPRGPYTLEIVDPAGQTVHTVSDLELSEFGGYSGSYDIPTTGAVGWYQFRLTAGFSARPGGPGDSTDGQYDPTRIVRFPMRVLVSDFTPAPFGVTTSLDGDLFEAGDDVVAETRAALYSGGPYADAEARITARIDARPFTSDHPVAAPFRFDTMDDRQNVPSSLTVAQIVGRVGERGEIRETIEIPEDAGNRIVYGALLVEGSVRDDRGRYVSSAASADFVSVDRLVGLRSMQWAHRQGDMADVDYVVVDARGAPVAGTDVHIDVERLETKASRVKGAGNAYLTRYVDEWIAAGDCDGTSTESPGTCRFVPEAPGSYRVTATIRDTRGRPHSTVLHTWVVGPDQLVWSSVNDDALEIVPEAAGYAIGDTARYLVKNPFPGARALVTIERYGILKQWVETLDGSTPIIEFEVDEDFMPGFYLSVLAISPRVDAPPPEVGELDLGKPAARLGYVRVPVEDPYKKIDVSVTTDAATYRPGDRVRARISAAPRVRGLREPIEVAVAVLDEAVLDLIQGGTTYFDPYEGFYTLDPLDVRNFSLLTRLVGRQKIELKGANPGGDGGATFSMRSLFEYVAYWNPALRLDADGTGEVAFDVPDNLTGWRVLVLATTPTDRMGLGMHGFDVNLPTEIRPVMPNHVTEGDRFRAAFSVMNRTDDARSIRVSIRTEGDMAEPAAHEETVRLGPFARTTIGMPVAAARLAPAPADDGDRAAGRIRFVVTAGDDVDRDGLTHELPVARRRPLEVAAQHGMLSAESDVDSAAEPLRFPGDARADAGFVGVVLAPSVIGDVGGAFRYVRDYGYTSWEQRLSRAVMASRYRALAGYLPQDLEWADSATLPRTVLAQAANHQAPNGGMAYFVPQDAYASPYLSAYTALAFTWLRDDGHEVPEAVEAKLIDYLDTLLKRDVLPDFYSRGMAATVRAVALAALARSGRIGRDDLERYRDHVGRMSLFGKAHYLTAALAVDDADDIVREIVEIVLQSSSRAPGRLAFNEVLDAGYDRILATPLRSNCAILSALAGVDLDGFQPDGAADAEPADPTPDLVRSITGARGARDHWRNTQENVYCVNALAEYARRYESATLDMRVDAAVGGEPLGTATFDDPRDAAVTLARPLRDADAGADSELTIERRGSGRVYYTARVAYSPADAAAAGVDAGIDVRREYSVERDGERVTLDDTARVARGELVRVDIFVSLPAARNFVVVDDPVPGGLEPLDRELATTSAIDADAGRDGPGPGAVNDDRRGYGLSRWSFHHQEIRQDAVRFYADHLPPGEYRLSYAAQAIADGEFVRLPVRAEEMYDPDVYGIGAPGVLIIEPPTAETAPAADAR